MSVETPAAPATPATPAPATQAAATPATPAAQAAPAAAEPAKAEPTILGGQPAKEEPQKQGSPEKYEDFKLPEGVTPDAKAMDAFKAIAKESGLSQEAAQKFVDFQAQNVKAEVDARLQQFSKQVADWKAESEKQFGATYKEDFGIASKTIERFGTPGLRQLLNDSGLGNHPEVVKFFHTVGKSISEDTHVEGRKAGGEGVSTASLLFPSMAKK